ncbi:hypothetical protein [Sphaerisporangium fuscum]|uniref:hypothetical protein n=1 Tax=Sphaerisporangium fuscum TaxID=2835868 RepID=UPI001BDC5658|nr:hypothetical protein [Sphaerisporangium fuscum]
MAASILLAVGVIPHDDHHVSSPVVQAEPAVGTPAHPSPAHTPGDADHDECPKPLHQPFAAGWIKHPPPASRHGAGSARRPRAVGEADLLARTSRPDVSALRSTRPTGPLLPVFRC